MSKPRFVWMSPGTAQVHGLATAAASWKYEYIDADVFRELEAAYDACVARLARGDWTGMACPNPSLHEANMARRLIAAEAELDAVHNGRRGWGADELLKMTTELLDRRAWDALILDKPEDRLYHAADETWWKRVVENGKPKLVRAEPPHGKVLVEKWSDE